MNSNLKTDNILYYELQCFNFSNLLLICIILYLFILEIYENKKGV